MNRRVAGNVKQLTMNRQRIKNSEQARISNRNAAAASRKTKREEELEVKRGISIEKTSPEKTSQEELLRRLDEYKKKKEDAQKQNRLEKLKRPPFHAGKPNDDVLKSKIPLKIYNSLKSRENTPGRTPKTKFSAHCKITDVAASKTENPDTKNVVSNEEKPLENVEEEITICNVSVTRETRNQNDEVLEFAEDVQSRSVSSVPQLASFLEKSLSPKSFPLLSPLLEPIECSQKIQENKKDEKILTSQNFFRLRDVVAESETEKIDDGNTETENRKSEIGNCENTNGSFTIIESETKIVVQTIFKRTSFAEAVSPSNFLVDPEEKENDKKDEVREDGEISAVSSGRKRLFSRRRSTPAKVVEENNADDDGEYFLRRSSRSTRFRGSFKISTHITPTVDVKQNTPSVVLSTPTDDSFAKYLKPCVSDESESVLSNQSHYSADFSLDSLEFELNSPPLPSQNNGTPQENSAEKAARKRRFTRTPQELRVDLIKAPEICFDSSFETPNSILKSCHSAVRKNVRFNLQKDEHDDVSRHLACDASTLLLDTSDAQTNVTDAGCTPLVPRFDLSPSTSLSTVQEEIECTDEHSNAEHDRSERKKRYDFRQGTPPKKRTTSKVHWILFPRFKSFEIWADFFFYRVVTKIYCLRFCELGDPSIPLKTI